MRVYEMSDKDRLSTLLGAALKEDSSTAFLGRMRMYLDYSTVFDSVRTYKSPGKGCREMGDAVRKSVHSSSVE